ncbi:MAG: OmpA family protein [Candidatus Krumholzibacteria bacterium]|nr:OmpA family protein [Candidatus Krumholzibacteria bacterium]
MHRAQFFVTLVTVGLLLGGCTSKKRMETEIAMRETTIAQMEREVEQKNKEIAARDNEISRRDDEIARMQEDNERLRREIDDLGSRVGTETERVDQLNEDLQKVLGDLQQKEKLWLKQKEGLSTITMPSAATFASGSTSLTTEGKAIIDTIWSVLSRYPDRDIFVEGHTDSVPIGPQLRQRYESNWELSAARAVAVLRYVLSSHETEYGRLAAVGYGEHRPIASNSNEEGRTLNRRVVISVRPRP